MSIILLILLLVALIAVVPVWPYSRKWGANFSLYLLTMMLAVFVVTIVNNS